MLDFNTALQRVEAQATPADSVAEVDLAAAIGRYLACDVHAKQSVPGFANSAMDGYALRRSDWAQGKDFAVSQRVAAGQPAAPLAAGTAARIFTGAMLPAGADTVILQEDTQVCGERVSFADPPKRGQHIRAEGQDIQRGAQLASKGQQVDAGTLGLLASTGIANLPCYPQLRVAYFSTGDELVEPGGELGPGQIYNSNRYALRALLQSVGALPIDLGVCADNPAATRDMLAQASRCADCVISTGGMSVGEADYVLAAATDLGEIDFWKIAMKPGKPLAFGRVGSAAFFGLPGNPVSTFVTFMVLVVPWLLKRMGARAWRHKSIAALAEFEFNNAGVRLDFLRGALTFNEQGVASVRAYDNQSSGVMSSLVASNVLIPVPPQSAVLVGQRLEVIPLDNSRLLVDAPDWPNWPA